MSEKSIPAKGDEGDKEYTVTYTCATPGCVNGVGEQNYEITHIGPGDIPETMICPTCSVVMHITKQRVAVGAIFEIWI